MAFEPILVFFKNTNIGVFGTRFVFVGVFPKTNIGVCANTLSNRQYSSNKLPAPFFCVERGSLGTHKNSSLPYMELKLCFFEHEEKLQK